jgi:DNA polymerase III subunit delta'
MSWSSIVGQQRVIRLLRTLYEADRLPHAFLFHGPPGVGKEAVALELTRVLNCESGRWEVCGTCRSCKLMRTLQHPHLKLIFALPSRDSDPDKSPLEKLSDAEITEIQEQIEEKAANPYHHISLSKGTQIIIGSIRDLRHEAALRSIGRGRTVVILCDAEKMNQSAANALLKTLEEPTGDVLLILCTSKRDALLPTILSRCQQVRFDMLSDQEIHAALERDVSGDRDAISLAVQLASGNYAMARELVESEPLVQREEIRLFIRSVVKADPIELMTRLKTYTGKEDRRALLLFLAGIEGWFRDVLALQTDNPGLVRNADLRESLEKFARHYKDTDCAAAIGHVEFAVDMIQKNVHLVTVLIVLTQRLRQCIR